MNDQRLEGRSSSRDLVTIASFLAQTRLFSILPFSELMILAASTSPCSWPEKHVIFRKDDPGDMLYVLKSGTVEVVLPVGKGHGARISILNPGDLLGELSLLDGRPRTATAITLEPAEALTVTREGFFAFLRRQPEAAIRILGILASRLRRTDELLGDALFRDVPSRLAHRLLELGGMRGIKTDTGIEIGGPVVLGDLARSVGTTGGTLRRYIRIFEANGLLRFGRHNTVLLDTEALRRLAEE